MNFMEAWMGAGSGARQVGKTTAVCEAAKKIGATVVCRDAGDAARVAREHGVKTIGIYNEPRGLHGPFLYDPDAVQAMLHFVNSKLRLVEKERDDAWKRIEAIRTLTEDRT